jgi:hypothetical protein
MAKKKTTAWGLKVGHTTPFRRTVDIGTKGKPNRVQLVFQPDTPYELTEQELAGVQRFVDSGLIVPWLLDPKGRRRSPAAAAEGKSEIDAMGKRIAELELDLAAAEEQVAILIEQVKSLGGEPEVEAVGEAEETATTADSRE